MTSIASIASTAPGRAAKRAAKSMQRSTLVRRVTAIVAGAWLLVVLVGVIGARWLAPYGATDQDLLHALQGPSMKHLLGTDSLGRDVLSRLMYGGAPTLEGVAVAVILYAVIGVTLGLIAGYIGGITDRALMAITSILIALPGLVLLFVVLSVFRNNTIAAMVVFGIHASPSLILLVRSTALSVRNELFVDAAKVSGLSPVYIVFQHVLPRARGLIVVQLAVFAATAIVVEATLSYLGFGVQPPAPSWGNMVNEAALKITLNPFMLYPTGGVIALTALAIGLLGDAARDSLASAFSASKLTTNLKKSLVSERHPMPEGAVLSVEELSVGYQSQTGIVPIVKDISFSIGAGQTVGLVGESGSGKTTVAFGILGVVGDGVVITGGQVAFDGADLSKLSDKDLAAYRGKRIAYVAQEPMVALDPNYKVGRQLAEAVKVNDGGLVGEAAHSRIIELLTQVELPDPETVLGKYPHELSGGMAQRVSIAFALAGRPELLIADEPTTALDVTVQAGILGLLIRLREQTGMSMLIITHDWGVIADVCDRVVVMYHGEIVEQGDAETIFSAPTHDYTKALLTSNPHGAKPGQDLPVIPGPVLTPAAERELASKEEVAA
jgi:peptide/nickel transport system permease protein